MLILSIALAAASFARQSASPMLVGGDVSEIPWVEATGGHYSVNGVIQDPLKILKDAGWNFIRLRVWNNPKDGFCDKAHTLAMARRVKAAGMALSIDFHYADDWADPGKQPTPKAWRHLKLDELATAVHDYTQDVVAALVAQDTPPMMVQVGNEIVNGMLWPLGKLPHGQTSNWPNLAKLVKAGIQGVHDAQGTTKILTMLHLDQGGNNAGARRWFDLALKNGIEFDAIGLSFYPFWHGTMDAFRENVNDLGKRYGKDVYVVEVAYPYTRDPGRGSGFLYGQSLGAAYPATPQGQANFVREITRIVRKTPGGRGKGVLYWAPTWISTKQEHIPWSNMATFTDTGDVLPAVAALGEAARQP